MDDSLDAILLKHGRHDLCKEETLMTVKMIKAAVLSDQVNTIQWVCDRIKQQQDLGSFFCYTWQIIYFGVVDPFNL